ncbi:MAG: hypothetical protein OXC37_06175, partial [Bdellovibrionaceae bacterium]|nr:hypothetical protein [Pseudobdellovibrionaceae bacterium]
MKYIYNSFLFSFISFRYLFILSITAILPFTAYTTLSTCPMDAPLIQDMQNIVCPIPSLNEAIKKDNLVQTIRNTDPFDKDLPGEVVKSVDKLSFMNRTVINKIASVHEKYQENAADSYTLSIAFYPTDVKEDSCPKKYRTITGPPNYSLTNKNITNFFQVAKHKDKLTICERTNRPRKGPGALPACSQVQSDSTNVCVSLDDFEKLS